TAADRVVPRSAVDIVGGAATGDGIVPSPAVQGAGKAAALYTSDRNVVSESAPCNVDAIRHVGLGIGAFRTAVDLHRHVIRGEVYRDGLTRAGPGLVQGQDAPGSVARQEPAQLQLLTECTHQPGGSELSQPQPNPVHDGTESYPLALAE